MHGLAFNLFSRGMLTDYAKITSHFAARRCGARTLACRVGTRADAWLQGAEASSRVSTRHASAQRAPSAPRFGCEVIIAWVLSAQMSASAGEDGEHMPEFNKGSYAARAQPRGEAGGEN